MAHHINTAPLLGILLVTLAFSFGCARQAPSMQPAVTQPPGARLFEANCAGCHGFGGEQAITMAGGHRIQFTDPAWQKAHSDEDIKTIVRQGRGAMPAFETTMTDAELNELVGYIRTLAKEDK